MSKGLIFWVLMILWFVLGIVQVNGHYHRVTVDSGDYSIYGGQLLEFVLFFLLGWKVFGFVVNDGPTV